MSDVDTRLQNRSGTYLLAIGIVIGMLLAGLGVPLIFGTRAIGPSSSIITGSPGSIEGLEGSEEALGVSSGAGEGGPSEGKVGRQAQAGARGAGAAAAGSSGLKLQATDRGVTPSSITVGVIIPEVGGAGTSIGYDLSSYDPAKEQRAYETYLGDINSRGGILGRTINPMYQRYNVFQPGASQAACLDLTQDKKVFAVLNFAFFSGKDILCVTQQNRTPLVKGAPESGQEAIEASAGYLSTTVPIVHRQNRNLAWELHRMGILQGKKIGVTANDAPRSEGEALISVLRSANYGIEHVSWFSVDPQTAQSQVPGEVLEMKRKGVQVVIMVTTFIINTSFAQTADGQQFYPLYAVNDWAGNSFDVTTQGMPRSWDGAIAITWSRHGEWRTNLPEAAHDRACMALYERSGQTVARSDDDGRQAVLFICDLVSRFRDAALIAGTNLTRDRLSTGIQSLGERTIPFTGGGSYKIGKFDGADFVRTKRWAADCRCWTVTEDYRRGRF